jgi:hypothetical protein
VAVTGRDPGDLLATMSVGFAEAIFVFIGTEWAEPEVCRLLDLARLTSVRNGRLFPHLRERPACIFPLFPSAGTGLSHSLS